MYLYDASAILNLVEKGKLKAFLRGSTLDFAVYETINAVWKECYLLQKIKIETAHKLIELLSNVFSTLDLLTVRGFEREVIGIALDEGVTFYDASYVFISAQNKLTLVTDDKKLASVAKKYADTITTTEITT